MYKFSMTKYYNSNSILHNMNPFYKLLSLIIFTITVLITNNIYMLLLLLLFVFLLILISLVPLKLYLKNLIFSISISLFILIINIITNTPFINSIISILKLILFLLYSGVLIYTTTSNDLVYGLSKVLSPFNKLINIEEVSMIITMALKFIPIIFVQIEKVYKSQISRGLNFNGNIKEKCDKILSIVIPAFILSLKRSDKVSDTLDIRLYDSTKKRSRFKKYNVGNIDKCIFAIHILLLIIGIWEEI